MRWKHFFRRADWDAEREREVQSYLEIEIDANLARGMPYEEARLAALRKLGNRTYVREEIYNMNTVTFFETLWQDIRYAVRALRKHPGFTTVAVLSLALGIGANTAVFSLLDTLLLTKLPVRDPDGLYQLIVTHRSATHNSFSYPDYVKLRDGFDIFDGVIAWSTPRFEVEINNVPIEAHGALVTGSFYEVLGVKPALGRLISPSDDVAGTSVAVLGYGFWQRALAGDPEVIGKVVKISGVPFTIIGVTSREFTGAEVDHPRDVTLPVHATKSIWSNNNLLERHNNYWMSVLVRLKPGVSMELARPILRTLWPKLLEADGPPPVDGWTQKLNIERGSMGISGVRNEFSQGLVILMTLVALVLLVACANIANLLLARATGRRKEIAVRLAMGAGHARLVRQWLTESLLLAALGGCAGLLLAGWITRALLLFLPRGNVDFLVFHFDARMLLFTAAVSIVTALVFGLLPALQAANVPPGLVMNDAGRTPSGGRKHWLSRAVIVAQVAVCLVLVVGALLFARSLQNLLRSDHGFQREGLLLVNINPAKGGFKDERARLFYRDFLDRLNGTPAFRSASSALIVPLSGQMWWNPAVVPGYVPAEGEMTTVYLNSISPGYFSTMGTPLLAGREFTHADDKNSRRVAIVNESFARRFFHTVDAVGRKFTVGTGKLQEFDMANLEIVGVVANAKYREPREKQRELVYVAAYQGQRGLGGTIQVRLAPGIQANAASEEIRKIGAELGKDVPVGIQPYKDLFERVLQQDRMVAILSALFGFLGVTPACIGVYGVMSYAVNSRSAEIGIRMALGARRASVVWMIMGETLRLASIGAIIGVPVALLASRFVASYLFGLTPMDPIALLMAMATILTVAALAGYLPARRASSLDPTMALRAE